MCGRVPRFHPGAVLPFAADVRGADPRSQAAGPLGAPAGTLPVPLCLPWLPFLILTGPYRLLRGAGAGTLVCGCWWRVGAHGVGAWKAAAAGGYGAALQHAQGQPKFT